MGEGAPWFGEPMAGTMPTISGQASPADTFAPQTPSIASQQPTGSLGNEGQAPATSTVQSVVPSLTSSMGGQSPSMAAASAPAASSNPMQTLMQAYGQMTPLDAEQPFPFFGL